MDADVNYRLLREKVFNSKDDVTLVASVGDRTTARLIDLGFAPDLEVIDNIEKRGRREYPIEWVGENDVFLETVNPPGGIDLRALSAVRRSLDLLKKRSKKESEASRRRRGGYAGASNCCFLRRQIDDDVWPTKPRIGYRGFPQVKKSLQRISQRSWN